MTLRALRLAAAGAAAVPLSLLGPPALPDESVVERPASAPVVARAVGAVERPAPAPVLRQLANVAYDSDFTFTRIRYASRGRGGGAWAHDWPAADRNMQYMLDEFTAMRTNTSGSNVFDLEDPEIFRNPILYVSEPGFWRVTDRGAEALREHLLKGGFLIFDDFEAGQWNNMAEQVARALPEGVWVEIDERHPIFSTFFRVDDIYVPHPLVRVTPAYRVIFEDNDPAARIMVLANHNSDLAEYWEYAAQGYFPVDPSNDAFRLGINYLVYGVTH